LREGRDGDVHRIHANGAERQRHGDEQSDTAPFHTAKRPPPERPLAARVSLAGADLAEVTRGHPWVIRGAAFRLHGSAQWQKPHQFFTPFVQVVHSLWDK
jgi:hypothetical protein